MSFLMILVLKIKLNMMISKTNILINEQTFSKQQNYDNTCYFV